MCTWFFLSQKFRQSVDCFIYCSIYKGIEMILCCWHLLTYQKINSIARRIKKDFLWFGRFKQEQWQFSATNEFYRVPLKSFAGFNKCIETKKMHERQVMCFLDFCLGWNQTKIYCPWHNDHKIVLHVSVSNYTDWCTSSLIYGNVFK